QSLWPTICLDAQKATALRSTGIVWNLRGDSMVTRTARITVLRFSLVFAVLRSATSAAVLELDPTFGDAGEVIVPGALGAPSVATAADGSVFAGGQSPTSGAPTVVRLLPDGTPDPAFGIGGVATVLSGTSPNTRIIVGVQPGDRAVLASTRTANPTVA